MDDRDKSRLEMAAMAAAGLVVLIAVLAAVYILVSSLFGGPAPTPAPAPVLSPTPPAGTIPTASEVIPSGPLTPTGGTPYSTAYPAVPTPVRPAIQKAELDGYGTDKDTYHRNDTADVYIIIKNTGNVPIDQARLHVVTSRYISMIGYVGMPASDQTLTSLGIQPGETKKAEYLVTIPADYQGISTVGQYKFDVDVYVWDVKIGSFSKEVQVQ